MPSDLEAELFPGECPRCGRLHDAADDTSATPALPGVPRTQAAALATACLIVAAGSALLAFQAGLFDADAPVEASVAPVTGPSETVAAPTAASRAQGAQPAEGAARRPSPRPEAAPPAAAPAAGDTPRQAERAPAPPPQEDRTSATLPAPTSAAPSAACPAGGGVNATPAEAPTAKREADTPPRTPRDPSMGTLTIVTARPVTLWLTHDQTARRFGPFETKPRKALDIDLPKGCYSVVLVDNGRRRQTTVSFLSDSGRLEF